MTQGIATDIAELIALKRFATRSKKQPLGYAPRAGDKLSPFRGRGMTFSETRHYQAGDDVRHMEWRVTARTGRAHVKVFQEERERPVFIVIDFNPSMFFGTRIAFKSVIAARLAAIIAWINIKQGDRIGGLLFGGEDNQIFMPSILDTRLLQFLSAISHQTHQYNTQSPSKNTTFSEALQRTIQVIKPGSLIILISDFYQLDPLSEQQIARLQVHNDVIAYRICDVLELTTPPANNYPITDGVDEQNLSLDTRAARKAYQDFCDERLNAMLHLCKRLAICHADITAQTDLPALIAQTFSRRNRV